MSMTIIVAATKNLGIGVNGGLPWKLPGEMKYFARGESRAKMLADKTSRTTRQA